jgi:hypothetical protein
MANLVTRLVRLVYQGAVEPSIALAFRRRRLRAFGLAADEVLPELPIAWHRPDDCRSPCPLDPSFTPKLVRRYARQSATRTARERTIERARLTPMVIDLARFPDVAAFEAELKRRSNRTLPKIRAAQRKGYVAHPFRIEAHVHDIHAIKTSMPFRAAGPVFDRWFLKPHHIAHQSAEPLPWIPPCCPVHWTIRWGVFLPEPGHRQGEALVGERLVAFNELMRIGDIVHYTDIMGHRDRLADGVMMLLHHAIVRWLIEAQEPWTQSVRAVLYGAAEHGGQGLLTWKKRAGFRPMRLRLAELE